MYGITKEEINRLVSVIDYSEALTITAGEKEARAACNDAKRYGFRAVVAFPSIWEFLWMNCRDQMFAPRFRWAFPAVE